MRAGPVNGMRRRYDAGMVDFILRIVGAHHLIAVVMMMAIMMAIMMVVDLWRRPMFS